MCCRIDSHRHCLTAKQTKNDDEIKTKNLKKKQKNCWSTWTVPFEGNVVQKVELQTQDEDS